MTGKFRNDVEIVLVGDELLKGERPDSHLEYLGRAFLRYGARVAQACVVGDRIENIADVVAQRAAGARVVVVTGGLGPTPDDITRDGVAKAFGLELEFHEPSWEAIQQFFADRGKTAGDVNRGQAFFPAGAVVIPNELGTAPGFAVDHGGATVFVLPGPPVEVRRMFEEHVLPRIVDTFKREPVRVETFRTIGVGESTIRTVFGDKLDALTAYTVSSLPSRIAVDIVLTEKPGIANRRLLDEEADAIERDLRDAVGNRFFERGERTLFEVVHETLVERQETVAVAESLTGGWIGKRLTDISGSSASFLADVVAYSNDAKVEYLDVRPETLMEHGAVSEGTCAEMADGVRQRTGATYGLATTGIAGPTGATPGKPVGLTFIGVSMAGKRLVERHVYAGNRDDVRRRASNGVVWLLYDSLKK